MSELETLKAQLANVESQLDAHDTAWEQDVKKLQRAEIQVRELREALRKVAIMSQTSMDSRTIDEIGKVASAVLRSAPPSGPTMERPYDRLYVIEHMREGAWRLHMGMNMTIVYAAAQMRMHELQKEWGGEWRVTRYIPVQPCCKNGYPWERHDCEKTQAPFDKTDAGEERKDLAKVPAVSDGFTHNRESSEVRVPDSADKSVEYSTPQDSTSRSEWISVETRLPELWQDVLVVNARDGFGPEIVAFVRKNHLGAANNADKDDFVKRGYTHWQPLPAPPSPARDSTSDNNMQTDAKQDSTSRWQPMWRFKRVDQSSGEEDK